MAMYHKNFVEISRKKTADETITQMELIPKCDQIKETCVTERAIVDVSVKKLPGLVHRSKRGKSNISLKKIDAETEPMFFSQSTLPRDCESPWGLIYKSEKMPTNSKYRSHKNSSSGRSSCSPSQRLLFIERTYTKNKGVQCDGFREMCTKGNPNVPIQNILEQLKRKLKGDIYLKSMLGDLEREVEKIFNINQKDNIHLETEYQGKKSYPKLLTHSNHNYCLANNEARNIEANVTHANLEATCGELENVCRKLKQERDTAIKLAADKGADLVETLVREGEIKSKFNETNIQIKEMSIKLENYAVSIKNLNEHVKKLQNENKELEKLKQQVSHLNGLLRNITEENKKLLSELHEVSVERNKLQIALSIKEQMLEKVAKLRSTSSSEISKHEVQLQTEPIDYTRLEPIFSKNGIFESPLLIPQSNVTSSSHSLEMAPSLYRGDSFASVKTPSPSSDHIIPIVAHNNEKGVEDGEPSLITNITDQRNSSESHFNINKLKKLKQDIKELFSEIRKLSNEISSKQAIDFDFEDISTDLNWSDENDTHLVSYVHISDLNTN